MTLTDNFSTSEAQMEKERQEVAASELNALLSCFEDWARAEGLELKKWTYPAPGHPYCDFNTNLALKAFQAGTRKAR